MTHKAFRFVPVLLVLGLGACAQNGAPQTATTALSCLDHPDYDKMPLPPKGNRGRVAQWLARPDGSGCHWTRNPG